jgi:hypothetical protein
METKKNVKKVAGFEAREQKAVETWLNSLPSFIKDDLKIRKIHSADVWDFVMVSLEHSGITDAGYKFVTSTELLGLETFGQARFDGLRAYENGDLEISVTIQMKTLKRFMKVGAKAPALG